jgi:hypothetical protein
MYISLRSPRGGGILSSLWAGIKGEKNIKLEPIPKPEAVGDIISFKLGYATEDIKKGDVIYFKPSELKRLKPLVLHKIVD